MKRPKKSEYAPFHERYLIHVPARGSVDSLLKKTFKEIQAMLINLPEEQGNYAYEQGKWTIKQLLMHIIDTERVFSFRILSFMRGDQIALPGFNQDFWMEEVDVSNRTMKDILKEWKAVRENTIFLARQCSEAQSKFVGTASNWKVSVRAYFFITIGHHLHHQKMLKELYGL
jgi:uncharacterized damage-inducible protein DinB